MLAKTDMQSAFDRAGIRDEDVQLETAIARYLNVTNDDVDRLREIVERSIEKLELTGKGHCGNAGDGHSKSADPRHPNNELLSEGHTSVAGNGHYTRAPSQQPLEDEGGLMKDASSGQPVGAPSSSSTHEGEGQAILAGNGHHRTALPLAHFREPSAEERAAALKVQRASAEVAKSLFDRMKTFGGHPWGDVGEHELAGMGRDGVMAAAIDSYLGPRSEKQRFRPLRELMSDAHFETIVTRVRGQSHAA